MKYNIFEPKERNESLEIIANFRKRLLESPSFDIEKKIAYDWFCIFFEKSSIDYEKKALTELEKRVEIVKDEHGYPLDKDHICFPTGHAMSTLFEFDNGRSKTIQRRCTRCGHEETDQYDYN